MEKQFDNQFYLRLSFQLENLEKKIIDQVDKQFYDQLDKQLYDQLWDRFCWKLQEQIDFNYV